MKKLSLEWYTGESLSLHSEASREFMSSLHCKDS